MEVEEGFVECMADWGGGLEEDGDDSDGSLDELRSEFRGGGGHWLLILGRMGEKTYDEAGHDHGAVLD